MNQNTYAQPFIIEGDTYCDQRGSIRFINGFDMLRIRRMYSIKPPKNIIRAWQGHKQETKWFFVSQGSFTVKIVGIDNLNERHDFFMDDHQSLILEIPGGYYNGFQAHEENSILMVFSDFGLKQSQEDDLRESLERIHW